MPLTTEDPTKTNKAASSRTYSNLDSDRTGLAQVTSAVEQVTSSSELTSVKSFLARSESVRQVTSAEKPVKARNHFNIQEKAAAREPTSNDGGTDRNTPIKETLSSTDGKDHVHANMIDFDEKFHGQDARLDSAINPNSSGNTSLATSKDVKTAERRTNEILTPQAYGGGDGGEDSEGDEEGGEKREGRMPEAGEITGLIFSHVG